MASSRWKRFAFFERHTLALPSEVLEDIGGGVRSDEDRRSSRPSSSQSLHHLPNDSVSLVITTASLPLASNPGGALRPATLSVRGGNQEQEDAVEAMWSSLTACISPQSRAAEAQSQDGGTIEEESSHRQQHPVVHLPSQGQSQSESITSTVAASADSSSVDGLVLAFTSSRETELVHALDLTVRCNPPPTSTAEVEDLDGWRGYFAPFSSLSSSSVEQQQQSDDSVGCVVGLAVCRVDRKPVHLACISHHRVVVLEDPHLYLSCRRPISSPRPSGDPSNHQPKTFYLARPISDGNCRAVDIVPGLVAVGTDTGAVLVFHYNPDPTRAAPATATAAAGVTNTQNVLRLYLRIPPPPSPSEGIEVVSVKLSKNHEARASVFVAYRPKATTAANSTNINGTSSSAGVCCYDLPLPSREHSHASLSAPSARHDLDGRYVGSSALVDAAKTSTGELQVTVARPDGLYSFLRTERSGVAPIDGTKLAICLVPPPVPMEKTRQVHSNEVASGYALVASTDQKSGRDAVDIYDSTNKLVGFHLLLSPGHKAVCAAGTTTFPTICGDGSIRGGRSSAVVLTSGGSLVTLTEKLTAEKISLLVQKNLYSAAIVVAYADPSYEAASITNLYRQYAEHLYRKGEYSGAIEQYCHTIGSLESSHVIFRYLDAPKIPLLVKYLEKLRARELATPVHEELLRTCYLKLNDTEAADAIAASVSSNKASMTSILSNLSNNPKDALATICSLPHTQAALTIVVHGASLARALPRETAGVVIALCLGTYSPKALAEAALIDPTALKRQMEHGTDDQPKLHEPYPFQLFATCFIENAKMLRLILTHCNRNKCYLSPAMRRTLLELTLSEWNQAKRVGDVEAESMRHKEAIAALTDSHCREIGDYDALVIVQLAGFEEGELLLYERLQMTPMLLERYAKDGSEKSRRQMLALCQSDPEILADVLGHFVDIASEKLNKTGGSGDGNDDDSDSEDILDDIREALTLARSHGVLPPVRVARILAGEGTGQFSSEASSTNQRRTVPLSVALDYAGTILDESRKEISRLRSEVEEYNQLCNSMEQEVDSLLRASHVLPPGPENGPTQTRLDIDELYCKVLSTDTDTTESITEQPREEFWRDMNITEDTFDTIARYFQRTHIY